jgi:hypothetical protein
VADGSDDARAGPGRAHEPGAAEAVEHLQRAAIEIVQALRSALDVVEAVVQDPGPWLDAAAAVGRAAAAHPAGAGDRAPGSPEPSRRPRVEHIPVEEV